MPVTQKDSENCSCLLYFSLPSCEADWLCGNNWVKLLIWITQK